MGTTPLLIWLVVWSPLAALTAVGSCRRGNPFALAAVAGFGFPVTWVIWFVEDNHREGRTAFRSR